MEIETQYEFPPPFITFISYIICVCVMNESLIWMIFIYLNHLKKNHIFFLYFFVIRLEVKRNRIVRSLLRIRVLLIFLDLYVRQVLSSQWKMNDKNIKWNKINRSSQCILQRPAPLVLIIGPSYMDISSLYYPMLWCWWWCYWPRYTCTYSLCVHVYGPFSIKFHFLLLLYISWLLAIQSNSFSSCELSIFRSIGYCLFNAQFNEKFDGIHLE